MEMWEHMGNIWRGDQKYNWMVQNQKEANGIENKYVISCYKNIVNFLAFYFCSFCF